MTHIYKFCMTLAILAAVAVTTSLAGEPTKFKGTVTIGTHEVAMKAGQIYMIKVEGQGFQPHVSMQPGFLRYMRQDFRKPNLFQSYYVPSRNETQTFNIVPSLSGLKGQKGPFQYTMEITSTRMSQKAIFTKKDELTNNDPPYKNQFNKRKHSKAYSVKLNAGQFYMIDMMKSGLTNLDPYLYLEDPSGKVVSNDDDGGEGRNARIVFRPKKAGQYRIIATPLFNDVGPYTLTVRTEEKK